MAQNTRQMQPLLVKPAGWIYWMLGLRGCLTAEVGDGASLRSSFIRHRVSRVVDTASIVMRIIFVEPVDHINSCYLLILIIHMRVLSAPLITINDDISSRLLLIRPHQDIVAQGQSKHP